MVGSNDYNELMVGCWEQRTICRNQDALMHAQAFTGRLCD
jgi:hypothetical protein